MSPRPTILQDGKLKPGIYKIQNVCTETYVDIELQSRNVCCRPAQNLEEGRGLWEIKPLGVGYSVKPVEPGKPEQFFTLANPLSTSTSVGPCLVAWRIEVVDEVEHRGFEYVRFCWGSTDWGWAVHCALKDNGTKLVIWLPQDGRNSASLLMWKLIPMEQGILPPYERDATGEPSTCTQRVESKYDDLGTIVTEVTVTTRRIPRAEGA